jgi:hypothetical protein
VITVDVILGKRASSSAWRTPRRPVPAALDVPDGAAFDTSGNQPFTRRRRPSSWSSAGDCTRAAAEGSPRRACGP